MGTSAKALKIRIKSVQSTEHITRAMQLVASSKLRRCTERMEKSRAYFQSMKNVFFHVANVMGQNAQSVYLKKRETGKTCLIVIGGDRGLAGGYNSNVFHQAESLSSKENTVIVPLGKRTYEFFSKRGYPLMTDLCSVESLDMKSCVRLAEKLQNGYKSGQFKEIYIVYTSFKNMLTQYPVSMKILPLEKEESVQKPQGYTLCEPSEEAVFEAVIPEYLSGILYCSVLESAVSEQASRRNAMDNATKNAEEMIESLSLKYNRARQGAITQEITEIVAGSEGLS